MWKYTGQQRPDFAQAPGPEQESVWDYPRPPALRESHESVEVRHGEVIIASSTSTLRVLETASPPTYYIPADDIDWQYLVRVPNTSFCEWKGQASYFALASDSRQTPVAWLYAKPHHSFAKIDQHASFYPGRIECHVDGERVKPQAGAFYGGWITNRVVGPFKGEPGTEHW